MAVTPKTYLEHEVEIATWVFAATDVGVAFDVTRYPGMTVQAIGAGSAAIEGSMDGTTWVQLHDTTTTGAAIAALTGGAMAGILENPIYVRPNATGIVTVILAAKSGR